MGLNFGPIAALELDLLNSMGTSILKSVLSMGFF